MHRYLKVFQSLFYWKSYCYSGRLLQVHTVRFCFNPCFTGSPTVTFYDMDYTKAKAFGFNPCFTGSPTVTETKPNWDFVIGLCFNPCFTGSPTVT